MGRVYVPVPHSMHTGKKKQSAMSYRKMLLRGYAAVFHYVCVCRCYCCLQKVVFGTNGQSIASKLMDGDRSVEGSKSVSKDSMLDCMEYRGQESTRLAACWYCNHQVLSP